MKVKVSELVFDFDFYPRHNVDSQHVTYLAAALLAGAEMPPIIIDKKSRRIIDGFHRARAALRISGDDAVIDCIEKTYKNECELFLEAVRLNASHGRALTRFDRCHAFLRAKNLNIEVSEIATAMNMTVEAATSLSIDRSAVAPNRLTVPIKQTIRHMAGKQLTKVQIAANEKLGGMNALFYVNQIIMLIEADLLNTSNEGLMKALEKLGELIDGVKATA